MLETSPLRCGRKACKNVTALGGTVYLQPIGTRPCLKPVSLGKNISLHPFDIQSYLLLEANFGPINPTQNTEPQELFGCLGMHHILRVVRWWTKILGQDLSKGQSVQRNKPSRFLGQNPCLLGLLLVVVVLQPIEKYHVFSWICLFNAWNMFQTIISPKWWALLHGDELTHAIEFVKHHRINKSKFSDAFTSHNHFANKIPSSKKADSSRICLEENPSSQNPGTKPGNMKPLRQFAGRALPCSHFGLFSLPAHPNSHNCPLLRSRSLHRRCSLCGRFRVSKY